MTPSIGLRMAFFFRASPRLPKPMMMGLLLCGLTFVVSTAGAQDAGTSNAGETESAATEAVVNTRVLPPLPFETPAPLRGATRVTRQDVANQALAASLELQEAQLAVDRARFEQLRVQGRNDGQFSTELNASRAETPVNSGISKGTSRNDLLRLDTALVRRFDSGTAISLRMENGLSRSVFPLVIDGVLAERIVNGPDYLNALTFSVTQSLLEGRSRAAGRSADIAAELQVRMAQSQLRRVEEQVVHEAMVAYTQLLVAETSLVLQQRNLARTQRQVEAAEARLKAGHIAPFERNLVWQRLSLNQEALLVANQELRRASRQLMLAVQSSQHAGFLLTIEGAKLAEFIEEDAALPNLPSGTSESRSWTADQWCERAMQKNAELDVASAQIALAEAMLLPSKDRQASTLDLTLGATSTGLHPDFLKSLEQMATMDALTLFGSLKFALSFRNRAARGEMGAAQRDIESARVREDSLRQRLCYGITDASETVALQQQRLALAGWRIQVAREGLAAEEARFARGLATVTQILDALENLETSELELLRVEADADTAWWTLQLQVGSVVDASRGRRSERP